MVTSPLTPVVDRLRRVMLLRDGADLTDGQLLDVFVSQKDEAAFEALVRRHGPMVLAVCCRVLRNRHHAEDAFQATFLVLARKAASIVPRGLVGNWLHGVAYRTALKARTMTARQSLRESQMSALPELEAVEPDDFWRDLRPLLDQELSRLPEKYRAPVVLCDVEGKTGKEAAQQLGCPEGTVASRLSMGRALPRRHLARRGIVVASGSLASLLLPKAAAVSTSTALVISTVTAGALVAGGAATTGVMSAKLAALTEGVINAMLLSRVQKTGALLLMVGLLWAGGSGFLYWTQAKAQPGPKLAALPKPPQADGTQNAEPRQREVVPALEDVRGNGRGRRTEPRLISRSRGRKPTGKWSSTRPESRDRDRRRS